jgi:DNA-binding NarL/FixJ family response regulator
VAGIFQLEAEAPVTPIRLLSADDHPLVREGIAALVATQPDIVLVAEACDGHEALQKFRLHRPDIALMDLQMPGLSGIDAIIAIRDEFPNARIIVLTTYGGDNLAKRALGAGAQAYILKSAVRKELLDTIRAVHKGQRRIHPEVADALASHVADETLSARELMVLKLIAAGNSNKLIAVQLSIAEETVKGHVKSILAKLRASDRTQAVTAGLKRGIIDL